MGWQGQADEIIGTCCGEFGVPGGLSARRLALAQKRDRPGNKGKPLPLDNSSVEGHHRGSGHSPPRLAPGRAALPPSWIVALLILPACAAPEPEPVSIRLTELFPTATVTGGVASPEELPAAEWRFRDHGTGGWESFHGVAGLSIREGLLVGTTTDALPLLHVERTRGSDDEDLLHAIEVRLRVSRGSRLSLAVFAGRKLDRDFAVADVRDFPEWNWAFTTPLVPGASVQTYLMTPKWPLRAAEIRHLLLRPSDLADAEFAIESVRLIFRREHLASIRSGTGWHSLGEIYRETVVSRAPETIRYRLKLPSRPRLDLELGTLAADPVTFRVAVTPEGEGSAEVLARTLTTAQRWETARVDLSAFAGEWIDLTLALSSERPGALGLWGSPAVRNLGGMPATARGGQLPRGVIVVIADNLRADHLEAYGYHRRTAPTLTRLAAAGTRFENCIPLATWTKISVPSILTSLEPLTHGVLRFSDRLPPSAVTLAEVFHDAGYATVAYFSNLYAGQRSGTQQGFEVIHDDRSLELGPAYWSKTARQYVDRLRPWLEAHRETPFFILLHVLDPHYPFEPLPPYDRLWADPRRKAEHQRQIRAVAPTIANPFMRQLRLPTRGELEDA